MLIDFTSVEGIYGCTKYWFKPFGIICSDLFVLVWDFDRSNRFKWRSRDKLKFNVDVSLNFLEFRYQGSFSFKICSILLFRWEFWIRSPFPTLLRSIHNLNTACLYIHKLRKSLLHSSRKKAHKLCSREVCSLKLITFNSN